MADMEELRIQLEEMKKSLADSEREKRAAQRDKNTLQEENKKLAAREAFATSTLPAAAGGTVGGSDGGSGLSGAAGGAASSGRSHGESALRGETSFFRRFAANMPGATKIPTYPRDNARLISWYRALRSYLANEDLEHTLVADEGHEPVRVITSTHVELLSAHPEYVIDEHRRAWSIIDTAVSGTELQERLVSRRSSLMFSTPWEHTPSVSSRESTPS